MKGGGLCSIMYPLSWELVREKPTNQPLLYEQTSHLTPERRFFALFGLWGKDPELAPANRTVCRWADLPVLWMWFYNPYDTKDPNSLLHGIALFWEDTVSHCTAAPHLCSGRAPFPPAHQWSTGPSSPPLLGIYCWPRTKEGTTPTFISALLKALRKSAPLIWKNTYQIFDWKNK